MPDNINIEITRASYDKINHIKNWYEILFNINSTKKKVIDYILNEFMDLKSIEYEDIQEDKSMKSILKNYRGDVNLDPTVKEYLQAIKEHINEKNINEVIKTIALQFIESNPDINEILLKNRTMRQKLAFDDIIIQRRKQYNVI